MNKPFFISACIITFTMFLFLFSRGQGKIVGNNTARTNILATCVDDQKVKIHYHYYLTISFLGEPYTMPKNIGIENDCLHPIQMHDPISGQVHIHSYEKYPFTVGDFFSVWGIIFNQDQLGSVLKGDRYSITMQVDGKENDDFQNYITKDGDKVDIIIKMISLP